jgi:Fe-S-cluster-containing hydrogenase component 2
MSLEKDGSVEIELLRQKKGYPSEERFAKGPVAVIECMQEIPCNPCETACKFGAICIGDPITNLPILDENTCIGCGLCIAACPGQAIFVVNKAHKDGMASVSFPYEFFPLPEVGHIVDAVDRKGTVLCKAKVLKVIDTKRNDKTAVITIEIPKDMSDFVRGMKRMVV